MTNRQRLIDTNIYDLLCNLNKNLQEGKTYCECIMQALSVKSKCDYKCGKCIAKWLNEEAK